MLNSVINDYSDKYSKEILLLKQYLETLHKSDEFDQFYSEYKRIIYPSIINRIYVSFEYLLKDLFIMIYKVLKRENEIDLSYLKLHELPGYIIEEAKIVDNKLTLELTDKVVSFTSKNLDVETISRLFSRVKVNSNYIRQSIESIDIGKYSDIPYHTDSTIEGRLKYFIEHRNYVSHSYIDDYQELDTILLWIDMLSEVYQVIFSVVINRCLKRDSLDSFKVLHVYHKGEIVCFDNNDNIEIRVDDSIFFENQNRIYFYRIMSIMNDNKEIENTKDFLNIGLEIKPISNNKKIIKATNCHVVHNKQ